MNIHLRKFSNVSELPAKAQTVLNQHFKHQNVALVRVETGITNKTYDVILQNGTKLEFDKRGNVIEIDCKQGAAVPGKLIPQAISKYLQNNYFYGIICVSFGNERKNI